MEPTDLTIWERIKISIADNEVLVVELEAARQQIEVNGLALTEDSNALTGIFFTMYKMIEFTEEDVFLELTSKQQTDYMDSFLQLIRLVKTLVSLR